MKTLDEATALARSLVAIGDAAGVRTEALITRMDAPLGRPSATRSRSASASRPEGAGPADLAELSCGSRPACCAWRGGRAATTRRAARCATALDLRRGARAVSAGWSSGRAAIREPGRRRRPLPSRAAANAHRGAEAGVVEAVDAERVGPRVDAPRRGARPRRRPDRSRRSGIVLRGRRPATRCGRAHRSMFTAPQRRAPARRGVRPGAPRPSPSATSRPSPLAAHPRLDSRMTLVGPHASSRSRRGRRGCWRVWPGSLSGLIGPRGQAAPGRPLLHRHRARPSRPTCAPSTGARSAGASRIQLVLALFILKFEIGGVAARLRALQRDRRRGQAVPRVHQRRAPVRVRRARQPAASWSRCSGRRTASSSPSRRCRPSSSSRRSSRSSTTSASCSSSCG